MKLIIDITEETYNDIQSRDWKNGEFIFSEEWRAIHNGTPLIRTPNAICWPDEIKKGSKKATLIPDNVTNGDVIKTIIKALFPDMELVDNFGFWVNLIDKGGHGVGDFYALWLNAPYKGENNAK